MTRCLALVLLLAGCHEDVHLIAGADAAQVACMVCAADGDCAPVEDGTACASGVCQAGECVATTCPGQARWTAVAAGEAHSCAVAWSGELFCWGRNDEGQLGAGDLEPRAEPVPVAGDWTAASAGWKFTCALGRDSAASCWGKNAEGQVANGAMSPAEPTPSPISDLPSLRSLTTGQDHACAVGVEGDAWCWGKNDDGRLGAAEPTRSPEPLLVDDGVARVWRQLAAGNHHTCGTDLDGGLWCWGDGAEGQLGTGDTGDQTSPVQVAGASSWLEVAAGTGHTCAIDADHRLWCWGNNHEGQLGLGAGAADGALEPTPVATDLRWAQVRLGERMSCAVEQGGTLWCWGKNDVGQLGLGDLDERAAPARVGVAADWVALAAGKRHVCAVRTSGGLYCWGANSEGQLNLGDLADHEEPTEVCGEDPD